MQENITPQRVANKIMMMRTQRNYSSMAFMIVEGESDAKVWRHLTTQETCKIEFASSKDLALAALKILEQRSEKGVLAVVDADYWIVDEFSPASNNVFFYDGHSLETMLIRSPALEKVIREYLPADRLDLDQSAAKTTRELIIKVVEPIGYLRWLNDREKLRLLFKELPVHVFLDTKTLVIDHRKMLRALKVPKQVLPLSDSEIEEKIIELRQQGSDPWTICQGHDLVAAIEITLPIAIELVAGKTASAKIKNRLSRARLDESLRLAYDTSFFENTQLYRALKVWETKNQPYRILA